MSKDKIVVYHQLFGGKLDQLFKTLDIPKTTLHRILSNAKDKGIYDWTKNKFGIELNEDQIRATIKYIASLSDDEKDVVNTGINTCKKVMVLPDVHYPFNINLSNVEKFMADYKPDVIIYLGDLLDLSYLSKYDKDNKLSVGDKLRKEYDGVIALIEKHRKLSKASEVYFVEGNHEYRVRKFLESFPSGTGFIEIPIAMDLKKKGIEWIELNKWVNIGKLYFTHGLYINTYHARKHLDMYQRNIIYGHTHTIQVHSGSHPFDKDLPHVAKSIGCLCNINPAYMKNRPNQWINSFYIAEIEKDGSFSDNIITIVKGSFRVPGFRSKRYEV